MEITNSDTPTSEIGLNYLGCHWLQSFQCPMQCPMQCYVMSELYLVRKSKKKKNEDMLFLWSRCPVRVTERDWLQDIQYNKILTVWTSARFLNLQHKCLLFKFIERLAHSGGRWFTVKKLSRDHTVCEQSIRWQNVLSAGLNADSFLKEKQQPSHLHA